MVANLSPITFLTGIKAVAFDLDDTLFDRRAALTRLMEQWLGVDEAREAMPRLLARDGNGHAPRASFFQWLAAHYPAAGPDGASVEARFRREFPDCITMDRATRYLLRILCDANLALAVLSNGQEAFQMEKFRASRCTAFFSRDCLLFSGTLGIAKPDPRAFAALLERLALPANEVLFVGDDPERDIAGAKAAGLKTCRLWRPDRADGVAADLVASSMEELYGWFREVLMP